MTSSSASQSRFSAENICWNGERLLPPNLKIYSFADLKSATGNFFYSTGVGAFGTVFEGWVDEETLEPHEFGTGMMVAVKKLSADGLQDFQEWMVLLLHCLIHFC